MLRRFAVIGATFTSLWFFAGCEAEREPEVPLDRVATSDGAPATEFAPANGSFAWPSAGQSAHRAASPREAARRYAADLLAKRVRPERRASLAVKGVIDNGRGPLVARLEQRVGGIEVHGGELRVLMRRDGSLVTIVGKVAEAGEPALRAFVSSPEQALAHAFDALLGVALPGPVSPAETRGDYVHFDLAAVLAMAPSVLDFSPIGPARVKPVYFNEGNRLVPAYYVELLGERASDGSALSEAFVIGDAEGRVLERRSLTDHVAFNYRVYAKAGGDHRPLAGPTEDFVPHPAGTPSGLAPEFVEPVLVAIDGLNKNPEGLPDPWLPADATVTTGNHVDAYADRSAPDGFSSGDLRAALSAPKVFDYTFDHALSPTANQSQQMAAVVQAFYATNWLHDWYYDSGFNEAAGNAQHDNYGRGGLGGDRMKVEIQDYAGTNNANMMTPADGASPRMQLYLFSAFPYRSLRVVSTGQRLGAKQAEFGPQSFDLTGELVLANDGVDEATDACEPVANAVGKVVLVDRGNCTYVQKASNVQAAGGVAMVVANNVPGAAVGMSGNEPTITIPSVSISLENGAALKSALQGGPVQLNLRGFMSQPLDSALDFGIVAHEYAHYMFRRLAGDCYAQQCGALSEGWGDFVALHAMIEEGDDLNKAFPIAGYAALGYADSYFGMRRAPYSLDPNKNALSFRHISAGVALPSHPLWSNGFPNNEVHNAGEVFTSMMFEGYARLLAAHPYEEARRRMSDYVVAGMALTPMNATYLEQRDALLAAAAALDPADASRLAQGFAARGAGTCAKGPERASTSLQGVVESFEVGPSSGDIQLEVEVTDACDADDILDPNESGRVRVSVTNVGTAPLVGAKVRVSSDDPAVKFKSDTVTLATILPFSTGATNIDVSLDPSFSGRSFNIEAEVLADGLCGVRTIAARMHANFDELEAASALDTVEAKNTKWEVTGTYSPGWSREAGSDGDWEWAGASHDFEGSAALVSPELEVSSDEPFAISFSHRHDFERDGAFSYEGGVIEISVDGGAWVDISNYATVNYGGTITDIASNPLGGRLGYVGQNASWPDEDVVTLDLGQALAGSTARIRFRFGTDEYLKYGGWWIDDIGFSGITNLPFPLVLDEDGGCSPKPEPGSGGAGGDSSEGGPSSSGGSANAGGDSSDSTGAGGTKSMGEAGASGKGGQPSKGGKDGSTGGKGGSTGKVPGANGGADSDEESEAPPNKSADGCGCRSVGGPVNAGTSWLTSLALAFAFARRRHRAKAGAGERQPKEW